MSNPTGADLLKRLMGEGSGAVDPVRGPSADDQFFENFESLVKVTTTNVRRAFWKIILLNLVLGLLGTALTVGVVGGVILGLLKLFEVI